MRDRIGQRYPLDPVAAWKARRSGLDAVEVTGYQEAGLTSVSSMVRAKSTGLSYTAAISWARGFAGQPLPGKSVEAIIAIMEQYSLTYRDVLDYRDHTMPAEIRNASLDALDALKRNGLDPYSVACFTSARISTVAGMWSLHSAGVTGSDAVAFTNAGVTDAATMRSLTAAGITGMDWHYFRKLGKSTEEIVAWRRQGVDGALAHACSSLVGRSDLWFAAALAHAGMTGLLLHEYFQVYGAQGSAARWLQARTGHAGPGMSGDIAAAIHEAATGLIRQNRPPVSRQAASRPTLAHGNAAHSDARHVKTTPGYASTTFPVANWSPAPGWPAARR